MSRTCLVWIRSYGLLGVSQPCTPQPSFLPGCATPRVTPRSDSIPCTQELLPAVYRMSTSHSRKPHWVLFPAVHVIAHSSIDVGRAGLNVPSACLLRTCPRHAENSDTPNTVRRTRVRRICRICRVCLLPTCLRAASGPIFICCGLFICCPPGTLLSFSRSSLPSACLKRQL